MRTQQTAAPKAPRVQQQAQRDDSIMQRPYVGKDALDITKVRERKAHDSNWPPKLSVEVSVAFEKMADNANPVPPAPPTPNPVRGRDPVYLVLGNHEIGTRIEVVSLSDNPEADFNASCKNEIFSLPLAGRDVPGRRASITLDHDQMKAKGIVPGETLLIRQVDDAGNASIPTLVYLDPSSWANQAFNEPVQGGGSQRVNGAQFDIFVGDHGVAGSVNPAGNVAINAKAAVDTSAPAILDKNIKLAKQADGQVMFSFDKAFEPGANVRLENLDSGQTDGWNIGVDSRSGGIARSITNGDRFRLTVTDAAGLQSKYEFSYSSRAADGKAPIGKSHTLKPDDIRFEKHAGADATVTAAYQHLATVVDNLTGEGSTNDVKKILKDNMTSWKQSYPQYSEAMDAAVKLLASPKFAETYLAERARIVGDGTNLLSGHEMRTVMIPARQADQGGVRMTVKNPVPVGVNFSVTAPTGPAVNFSSNTNNRDVALVLPNVKNGDPIVINYTDREGVLHTHTFTYNEKAEGGKLKNNALNMRINGNRLTSNVS
jgi:hypothetical protein